MCLYKLIGMGSKKTGCSSSLEPQTGVCLLLIVHSVVHQIY
jgi:hypothetical protein